MMTKEKGLSLLELLFSLLISGILLGLAVPGFSTLLEKNQSKAAIANIHRAYQYARQYAVNKHTPVHICGSDDGVTCSKKWTKHLLVFIDTDHNNQPDITEIILYQTLDLSTAHVRSRISLGRKYTTLKPNGRPTYTGSFVYCPSNSEASNIRRITWNTLGRSYAGVDMNKDGIVDDTGQKNISKACSF